VSAGFPHVTSEENQQNLRKIVQKTPPLGLRYEVKVSLHESEGFIHPFLTDTTLAVRPENIPVFPAPPCLMAPPDGSRPLRRSPEKEPAPQQTDPRKLCCLRGSEFDGIDGAAIWV